jgi:Ni/Fe-hydrogenase subunit HybB-like protein
MVDTPAPEKKWITPFNVFVLIVFAVGLPLVYLRWFHGIGSVANLSHDTPWGFWIGFDVMAGVALAAGGYVMASAVHLFGMKEYEPVVRPAILTGFLGYVLVIIGVGFDLGRPWNAPYMLLQPGLASILFLVGLHVGLYCTTQFVEISPAVFEWLRWKRWRKVAVSVTLGATVFGVILSTLHQSALGAMLLITPTKLHPLWYSPFIGLFFFVSSIAAGLAMVTFEGMLSHRYFGHRVGISHEQLDNITLGLGKAACITLGVYFAIKMCGIAHGHAWLYLATPYGIWFLVEMIGFVLTPCILYLIGYRERRPKLVRFAAFVTVLGIILNRLNVTVIAFNWQLPPERGYFPAWTEFWISLFLVTSGLIVYRWIVKRMPILDKHPEYDSIH